MNDEIPKVLKRDQKLVSVFLEEYKKITGSVFEVKEWVDDQERTKPAVEAIAVEKMTGVRLAIEHTLLQPFKGERDDTQRFLAVVGELERDASLKTPRFEVSIYFRVGAVPNGIRWPEVSESLRQWIRDNISRCPDGDSKHNLQHSKLNIEVLVSKTALEHHETGLLLFGRYGAPDSLLDVLRTAFNRKLQKLAGTEAEKLILLLEKNVPVHGNKTVHDMIKSLAPEFDELKKIDEIWWLGTSWWELADYLSFTMIWPDIKTWVDGHLQ